MKTFLYISFVFSSLFLVNCGNRTAPSGNTEDSLVEVPLEDTTAIDNSIHEHSIDSIKQINDSIANSSINLSTEQLDIANSVKSKKHKKNNKKDSEKAQQESEQGANISEISE